MSANRTQNSHAHRIRRRPRATDPTNHLRKFSNYLTNQAARLTAIVGVTSVTEAEILAAHAPTNPVDVKARYVRGAVVAADVTALGINIL